MSGHEEKKHSSQVMVEQLEEVISEAEEHANTIFSKLDNILAIVDEIGKDIQNNKLDDIRNNIYDIMSIMQFHDFHKQKIERVINNMVILLSNEDIEIVTSRSIADSARHIAGDKDTKDLLSDDELAALVESMGKK